MGYVAVTQGFSFGKIRIMTSYLLFSIIILKTLFKLEYPTHNKYSTIFDKLANKRV